MGETKASRAVLEWTKQPGNNQTKLAEAIAVRLGRDPKAAPIAQSTISAIVRGASTPRGEIMAALKVELGIEPDDWITPAPPASTPALPDSADDASRESA